MSKKAWFYIGFFVVLVVGFYFALTRFIPGFGKKELPILSYVQPFSFNNQEGRRITENDILGRVYVAEYFFTTCKGICPKMNHNMQEVYEKFKDQPDFRILSHTVDPDTDSVPRMKHYADSLHADPSVWWFLTGSKDSLYEAARRSYLLDDPKNSKTPISEQFLHTQFFALVDKDGRVRKIYDGLKKDELSDMEDDIEKLLKAPHARGRFLNNLFNNNPN